VKARPAQSRAKVIFCVQGAVSPLLTNLFLDYAFDRWMRRNRPGIPFEPYADDAICHCCSGDQAQALSASLEKRFAAALALPRRRSLPRLSQILERDVKIG
jgi:hypothetical protein